MKTFNKVFLIGFLGKAPELYEGREELKIASVSLATSWRNGEGEDVPEWHQLVAFGKKAEYLHKYFKKGVFVHLEGHLQTQTKKMEDESYRSSTRVVIERITHLERKKVEAPEEAENEEQIPAEIPF